MPSGGVRLQGGAVMSDGEPSLLDSDVSSIISISDRFVHSDTEEEDGLQDRQKYRMPDGGKTRLSLRQLPPSPSRRQATTSTPSTPRHRQAPSSWQSPTQPGHAATNGSSEHVSDSDFVGSSLSRAGSIYTLGRATLAGQLATLMSLRLPDADSLAKRISSIPTSTEAAKLLSDASEQIRLWISKASSIFNDLNADDDVEWAAAGGREGIEDIESAVSRFQNLIEVYVVSIERLQTRKDAGTLSFEDLSMSVKQMEGIFSSWQKVKDMLKIVKEQVEIAMEWEELWNVVLGEIGQEMEGLNRLVFEMEEKRHSGAESLLSSKDSIDLNELETIVEERPGQGTPLQSNRLSLPPLSSISPLQPSPAGVDKDDSSLLALFARMQPLRASLDFLPMRLSGFEIRGGVVFPSACQDLAQRRDQLETLWTKLEADANSLRKELGEDRWVLVFRDAGKQAIKMEESITRSYSKLKDAVDCGEYQTESSSFAKKVENYEAKKLHYGPAIERVLAIIDRGVQDRLTVNGEILRLQADMKQRWSDLQAEISDMDLVLEELDAGIREKQLRDSVSTVISERSIVSSLGDTPGSSPASSVIGTSRKSSIQGSRTPTPLTNGKARTASTRIPSSIPRRIPLTQSGEFTSYPSSSPLATRVASNPSSRNEPPTSSRPRWVSAMKTQTRDFLPLSALEPSPYAKTPVVKQTKFLRSTTNPSHPPATRSTMTPRNVSTPNPTASIKLTPSTIPKPSLSHSSTRNSSLPVPIATPARPTSTLATRKSYQNIRTPVCASTERRSSMLPYPKFTDGNDADTESPTHHKSPPVSVAGRRSSMLPTRSRDKVVDESTLALYGNRPNWRL